jgi:hypothetical protein
MSEEESRRTVTRREASTGIDLSTTRAHVLVLKDGHVLWLSLACAGQFPEGTRLVVEGFESPGAIDAREGHVEGFGYRFELQNPRKRQPCSARLDHGERRHVLFEALELHAVIDEKRSDEDDEELPVKWPLHWLEFEPPESGELIEAPAWHEPRG